MNILVYFFLLFLIILGITNTEIVSSTFDMYLKISSIFVAITCISYLIIKRFDIIINLLTLWFGLQRFIGLILSNIPIITIETFRIFFLLKEGIIVIIFLFLFILFLVGKIKIIMLPLDKILIIFCLYLILNLFLSDGNFWVKVLALRRFIMLPIMYFIGRLALISFDKFKNTIKYTKLFALIICLYGAMDYFGLRTWLYTTIMDIYSFFVKQALAGFIPFSWFGDNVYATGIFTEYSWGMPIPRFLTTFLEPTTLGSFLTIVLLFSVFCGRHLVLLKIKNVPQIYLQIITNIFLAICLFLTFSKGALVILFCASSFIVHFNKKVPLFIKKAFTFLVSFFILGSIAFLLISNSGASEHITGLKTGILTGLNHPLGLGLGNAGNYASLVIDGPRAPGAESGIGTLFAQLGIIGASIYIGFVVYTFKNVLSLCKSIYKSNPTITQFAIVTLGCFCGYIINSLLTESAWGLTGNLYYFLFLGIIISLMSKKYKKEQPYDKNAFSHP